MFLLPILNLRLSLLCLLTCGTLAYKKTEIFLTPFGNIQGFEQQPAVPTLGPVNVFLGVPYGVPPIKDRRFTMPQTAARWTNMVKQADELPKVCVQNIPQTSRSKTPKLYRDFLERMRPYLRKSNSDEDCLYLNIYAPKKAANSRHLFPVLVLIHGESYEWGSGNPYNASVLASFGELVVVTLNYRLGVFGFLSSGDPFCRGNWGLGDIVIALQFLKNFIQPLGGNPNQMTVLGWGTGASLVQLLMSSPISAPAGSRLFERAILLSGSSLSSWAMVDEPEDSFYTLAESLGCATQIKHANKTTLMPVDNIADCVRGQSVRNISLASDKLDRPSFLNIFGPVIDGTVVHSSPTYNLEHHGTLFQEVDLMVGLDKNEVYSFFSTRNLNHGIEEDEQDKFYRTLVRNTFDYHRAEILEAIKNEYTDWRNPGDHPLEIRDNVVAALSDALYAAPLMKTAHLHVANKGYTEHWRNPGDHPLEIRDNVVAALSDALHAAPLTKTAHLHVASKDGNQAKSVTYQFLFNHETRSWDRDRGVDGSIFGEALPYILGYPLLPSNGMDGLPYAGPFTAVEKTISETLMRFVSNFARTGNPHEPLPYKSIGYRVPKWEALRWMPFQSDTEPYLQISENPKDDLDYYRARETAFWNKFLPSLHSAGRDPFVQLEHNFLPEHFKKGSYFGKVRPFGGYENYPFPPPPLPPTPMPREIIKLIEEKKKNDTKRLTSTPPPITPIVTPQVEPADRTEYSTILSVTVAVGCALLVLNILVFAGIYHQRDKQKRSKKQQQNQIQLQFDLASPVGPPRILQSPSSITTTPMHSSSLDNDLHPTLRPPTPSPRGSMSMTGTGTPSGSLLRTFPQNPRGSDASTSSTMRMSVNAFPETEPLLTPVQISNRLQFNEPLLNPACPRHGRPISAAEAAAALEEIQV